MSKNQKKIGIARMLKAVLTLRVFIVLSICYLAFTTAEEYFNWIYSREMPAFIFGVMTTILVLAINLVAILIIARMIIDKTLSPKKRISDALIVLAIIIALRFASYEIFDYLSTKGGGIIGF
jgi:hypothetical protein